jgi:GDP-D-mannose 3',5'-epimerase
VQKDDLILVTGAGGFIGGHLVRDLLDDGFQRVRAVDVKPVDEWYQRFDDADNRRLDLRELGACRKAADGASIVLNLAGDMGGMGFIAYHKARCMLSVLINTHMLMAAQEAGVERFLFASSACVYAADKQADPDNPGLKESDAYPAEPEDGYGWEKLFGERMCRHFYEDFGLQTRSARYHNVYGPYGSYAGGREKAPAAICRKVIEAKLSGTGEIEIWGDGKQTRSFTYVDDCLIGTRLLVESDVVEPINIGSAEIVSIDELVDVVEEIARVRLRRRYDPSGPQGVRGRSSDNTLVRERLGWEPSISLRDGMEQTYRWIYDQMVAADRRQPAAVGG